jgi:cytidylate kinase
MDNKELKYVPGTYLRKRPDVYTVANQYAGKWEQQLRKKEETFPAKMSSTICFSRQIGVGALEIADILAEKIGYSVADREILDCIAKDAKLSKSCIDFFDEHYPGKMNELSSKLFKKKSFLMSDYVRYLFGAVFSIAGSGPTIFVGRGVHLIMPRHWVLAVRFVASKAHRVKRLAGILKAKEEDVKTIVDQHDKEQKEFLKKAFGKTDASPYEFDMVINCDHIKEPKWAAEIVAKAYKKKFDVEAL